MPTWRLTERAADDMARLARYHVARHGIEHAETVLRRLYADFDAIALHPGWGKASPLTTDVTVRERLVEGGIYWVAYKIEPDSVAIWRVLSTRARRPIRLP